MTTLNSLANSQARNGAHIPHDNQCVCAVAFCLCGEVQTQETNWVNA
jgi:hypothetical protein